MRQVGAGQAPAGTEAGWLAGPTAGGAGGMMVQQQVLLLLSEQEATESSLPAGVPPSPLPFHPDTCGGYRGVLSQCPVPA